VELRRIPLVIGGDRFLAWLVINKKASPLGLCIHRYTHTTHLFPKAPYQPQGNKVRPGNGFNGTGTFEDPIVCFKKHENPQQLWNPYFETWD
jgi:hypothetical protein